MSEIPNTIEISKKVLTLHQFLEAIRDIDNKNFAPQVAVEVRKRLGANLWKTLPSHVITLDLGNQVQISRPETEIRYTPLAQRETWNLEKVDQYGTLQARQVQQEWKPIFPPQKP